MTYGRLTNYIKLKKQLNSLHNFLAKVDLIIDIDSIMVAKDEFRNFAE